MEDTNLDVLGPVDYLVVGFPADRANFSGEMAAELTALIDRKLVRVLDLVIMSKDLDGAVTVDAARRGREQPGAAACARGGSRASARRRGSRSDRQGARPGNIAAVLVYENSWAAPFASAVRRSGGQLVADGRVHTQALLAAIEAEDETNKVGA